MDRLHELEVFVAVAAAGSFAKAGRRLRISPPAVTRAIAALEGRLGARLFNRTTRRVIVTDVGKRYLDSTRRILGDLDTAAREAVGETAAPHGHLTLTASVTLGRIAIAPVVCEFLAAHSRVSASLLLVDRVVNLVEEGVDLAVRIGPLPDSSLIAKRIGSVRRVVVASPAYLERRGRPRTPADLRRHAVIAFTGLMPNREWRFLDGRRARPVSLVPRLEVNDAAAAIAAAERGDGITVALSYMVADKVRAARLTPVLDEFSPPPVGVHLVHPPSPVASARLRAFIDFATPRLRAALDELALPVSDVARAPAPNCPRSTRNVAPLGRSTATARRKRN